MHGQKNFKKTLHLHNLVFFNHITLITIKVKYNLLYLQKNYDFPFLTDTTTLVPVLDKTVPACSNKFTWFVRVPQHANTYTVMSLPFLVQFRCFPVPYITLAISIPRYQVAEINMSH